MATLAAAASADRDLGTLRAEYQELPGLRLTLPQVARLLDVDRESAAALVGQLEVEGLLLQTAGGIYRRSAPLMS
jgi:hypothetical protein